MPSTDALRVEGNALLAKNNLTGAIQKYSEAIDQDPRDWRLFSNRSAARLLRNELDQALNDAESCIALVPDRAKGYVRKANVLLRKGALRDALKVCEEALDAVDSTETGAIQETLEDCENKIFRIRLQGRWRGRVSDELGGYIQSMDFDANGTVRIGVFGRSQSCTYALDLSQKPHMLTILFGPDGKITNVPYIIDFQPGDSAIKMCCPYLVPDLPTDFTGPGLVLMHKIDTEEPTEDAVLQLKISRVGSLKDSQARMLAYLDDFRQVLLALPVDSARTLALTEASEADVNKEVIRILSAHGRMSELEQVYGSSLTRASFGIIAGGDDFYSAPGDVQSVASEIRELLVSRGFMSVDTLERARLQYSSTSMPPHSRPGSRDHIRIGFLGKSNRSSRELAECEPLQYSPESDPVQTESGIPTPRGSIPNEHNPTPVWANVWTILGISGTLIGASFVSIALRRMLGSQRQ